MTPGIPFVLLLPLLLLTGCDSRERATRNEIYQLAYSKAQLQDALEACDPNAAGTREHAAAWSGNFQSAEGWLGITADAISGRQAAARAEPAEIPENACPEVRQALKASLAQAARWSARISARQLCGWMSCD
jgi:hypothetical protein